MLSKARSTEPRRFGNPLAALNVLRDIGITVGQFDASEYDPADRKPNLGNIVDYIAQDNPIRAEEFGQELRAKVVPLAQHPKLGRTGRPGLPPLLRELVAHRNHIVFYRVPDEGNRPTAPQ